MSEWSQGGLATFCPTTYRPGTYIVVPGHIVPGHILSRDNLAPGQYGALFDIILLETFGNFWQ